MQIARATAVPTGLAECGAATTLELTATITADRATAVTYHWEPAQGTIAKETIRFARQGSRSVTTGVTIPGGAARKGRFALVVDAPRPVRRSVAYDVECTTTPAPPAAIAPGIVP